jgi:(p)ppGpp synthase/HD superfamily hydrolase
VSFEAWAIACRASDNHPFCVAAKVFCGGGSMDAGIVALLHDSLEDEYATQEELVEKFPTEIVQAVVALTRQIEEPYKRYLLRVRESGDLARQVKLADAEINLERSLSQGDSERARYYVNALELLA